VAEREHDLVLLGCTGFTGGLTAEYLSANAPPALKWALAGRNRDKLECLRERLGADVPLVEADTGDPYALRDLAESTRVVVTTVGPYMHFGEPVVAACAEAGTAYADLTGEPEFRNLMWLRWHRRAQETGARIVHSCGFDSIPADLGTLYTVQQLPEGVPIEVRGVMSAKGSPSGGTYHSAINIMAGLRRSAQLARQRRAQEGMPPGRRVHVARELPRHDPDVDGWTIPLPTIDPEIVVTSAAQLDRYGPDFTYSHNMRVGPAAMVPAFAAGAGALAAAAQAPPLRKLLLKFRDPGEGPSPEQRAKSWFRVSFRGEAGGRVVRTSVSGGDPGYGETAKMLAESGMCLALDDLPDVAGQLTTAVAMGDRLIERLRVAGIRFEGGAQREEVSGGAVRT